MANARVCEDISEEKNRRIDNSENKLIDCRSMIILKIIERKKRQERRGRK